MIEIYHCSVEVQAGLYSITDEQEKCLQSIIDQIELRKTVECSSAKS